MAVAPALLLVPPLLAVLLQKQARLVLALPLAAGCLSRSLLLHLLPVLPPRALRLARAQALLLLEVRGQGQALLRVRQQRATSTAS